MGEYAQAGINYSKIGPFKSIMQKVTKKTAAFPERYDVYVHEDIPHSHGALWEYRGSGSHVFVQTTEGLGNLNWIAEWMYAQDPSRSYYDVIARAAALIIVIDVLAQGGMPVMWTNKVESGDSDWFTDLKRADDYARGCIEICSEVGMCLGQGDSSVLQYIVKPEPPIQSCPSLSGCVSGVIAPHSNMITGRRIRVDDRILGVPTPYLHANGVSLVIKRALTLKDQFLTKLPNGRTLGEEALMPIPSYVTLVEALFKNKVPLHAVIPATGGGVSKIAFDKRPLTYRITKWVNLPVIMEFMLEIGVSMEDVLTTFNCGIGMYFIVPPQVVNFAISAAEAAGYKLVELGVVEEGDRRVIFGPGPKSIILPPPQG